MQTELSLAKKNYTDTIEQCKAVNDSNPSDEILIRSAIACSEASEHLGSYEDFIEMYRGVNVSDNDRTKIDRLLLNACLYEGDNQLEDIDRYSYYNQALIYGEKVVKDSSATVEDELALAKAYTYLEMYDKAREMLLASKYIDDDYRINMWLASVEYKSSGQSTLNASARSYYEKALQMESYSVAVNKGTVDPIMNQLGEL